MPDAQVYKFESLPIELHRRVNPQWLLYLAGGFLVTLLTPLLWGSLFYSHTVLRLPDPTTLLDLQVSLSGCDVVTVPGSSAEAHLSYWHLLGSGSMEIVNHTLRVHAMYNRKFVMLGCVFVLHLPEFRAGSAQFNFNFVNMTVQQDGFSEGEDSQTSKQMASVSISDMHVRGGFHLDVSTTARTTLSEIRAASLQVHVKGGYIGLHHSRAEHGKADIHAQDAMVSISTKGVPVKAEIPDEIFKYAALAAPTVHQASNATGRLRLYQLSGLSADGRVDEPLEVRVDGEGSTAYIQASDPVTSEMCKTSLQVIRGSAAAEEGTVLLPATRELLGKLSKWLHTAKGKQEPRYVVNVHLLAPNAPTGMLKLLSSTVYHAMSLSLASIVTGGMLRPRVLRIVAPVSGMRWLFPQDACDPAIGNLDDAQLRFGEQQLQAISPEVDIVGMNLTSARWIWDPKGSKAYVFDKVDAKSTYFWRPRLLTVKDFWIFLAASGITLTMGLAAGVVVLLILGFLVIPSLREELRKIATFRTASYRMQCSKDSETWALHPSMVHWPTRGVLLRWAKRPKAKRFSTICCQARLWPDAASLEGFKGIVRTRHIAVDKLPCPEEFPDIRCFLFVVDVKQDVGGKQYYRKEYDVELAAIGQLQAEQEQPPLHAGRPYQFQVIAFDEAGAVIETSAWSRPTMIDAPRKFVELPLLLWQGWCRILPSSTFNHFLNKHCAILPEDPTMRITLKRLRLILVAPGPPSLAGAPPSVAGTKAQVQEVQVCFSAGGNFKATDHVKLPSQDERSEKRLVEPLSKVFPGSNRIDPKQGCIVLDAFSKELELDVGQDVGDQLTIEVSVTSEDGTETTAAKWRHNWSHLLDVFSHRRSATQELADEIVLLDGRTPVAFLSAQFEISNPCLPSTARPPPASNEGFPRIFDRIRPGCVVYWSESVKLDWDVPAAVDRQDIEVEVVLVGNEVDVSKLEQGCCQPKRKSLSTKLGSMQLRSGQHSLVMCSSHLVRDGIMCCHLQAFVTQAGTRQLVLCSHQFALVRPVLIQDLELCYAGFCSRNGISMEQIDYDKLDDFGIRTTERLLHLARGFRAPLPVPHEMQVVKHVAERRAALQNSPSFVLIENGPSVVLSSGEDSLQLQDCRLTQDMLEGVYDRGDGPTAKAGGQAVSLKEALTTPLLASSEDGEKTQAPSQQKPRSIDGHRLPVRIPVNVFWRRSSDWLPDPLLQYGLLPTVVSQMETAVGHGLKGLLLTFLFWVQFVVLLLPVMCLYAFVIWHDAVHSATRTDLVSRNAQHFFLLDFLMEPTVFRFVNLDFSARLVLGFSLAYLSLIAATVAYSMVIGVPKPLPWDGFFSKADNFIMCVTSILVAGTTLILTNALVWVVLGSLIRPADLIPYAIMVAAVATMGHSMLSKFRGMKNYCQSQMVDLLDAALVAIFKVMAKDKTMMSTVEDRKEKFEALKDQVAKLLPDLDLHVGKAMEKMVRAGRHREGTDEFLSKLHLDPEAGTQTQVVPATAQAATDAKVEAQDSQAGELHMQPATASAEHKSADKERERKVKKLSKHLALHSKTVELMLDCFENRVVLKRLSDNAAAHSNSSASTLASLVSIARRDCLFGHFLRPLEAPGLPKDAPETEPRVLSLLCHLQNEEMERMDAVVAKCLTQYLNWPRIGREVEFFCSRTLVSRVILNAVERELSVVVQGSAASEVVLGAYRVGYELFETRYRTKPLEIFADCGLLDPDVLQRPQVQFILNAEIDAQLHGGGLTPGALIAAVRSLCLHGEEKSLMPGSQPKAYFWYKGLVAVLKDLGWSREELEPSKGWLQNRWDELTERCDLFEYSSAEEVVALVLRLTNGGLWKAATKSLLLKTGICGYASCHGAAEKAGKLAKELDACDILDLTFVSQKCHWPADVTKLWEEHACASSPEGPVVLPVSQVMRFMEALVYDLAEEKTEESGKEARRFLPLSPFSESMEDLAWQKELGRSPGLWHVQPSGRRKLRGLWLELVIQVFDVMDCIPTDLDLFFQCQEATTTLGDVSFMLQLDKFKEWLKRDYFSQLTDCTFNQFKVIVRDMLKCHIPEKALMEQVFEACPVIPDDDKGELRAISDLAAALYAYTDHGLWSEALRLVAKRLLPAGNSRDYALTHLEDEFEATDVAKRGVLSVMESLDLLQNLAVPGLTCADLGKLLEKELGLEVPRAELHKYFTTMDVNGDGLLQDEEFIQVVRFLMLDYYPHHILKHLNLSLPQIALFMSGVLAAIGVVFLLVTLVISFFEVGEDIGATLHGGFSGIFGVVGKRLSDEGIGFEDTMKNLELRLEAMMVTALVTVLGLSKEMQDVFSNVIASAEARLV